MARPRPPSIWIALLALVVVVAFQAALAVFVARSGQVGWAMYAFAGVLWLLVVAGVLRGSRLAWLWARYLTLALGALVTGVVIASAVRRELRALDIALALLGLALPLFVTGIALSRRSAYAYFDLVCPTCAARTGLGADLLFRHARCRSCQNVW